MTGARRTLLTLLCLAAARLPLMMLLAALLPDVSVAPEMNYAASIAESLLMFALPGWLLLPELDEPAPAWRGILLWMLLAAGAAVLARATLTPLNDWWAALVGADSLTVPVAQGAWMMTLQVLALAIVPAIAEEMFFRGALLQNLLRCCGRGVALLLTVLMFALMHGSLAGLPGHLAISLLLTLLMLHSGSILVPVTAHLTYNISALFWPETTAFVPWLCGCALAGLSVVLLRLPTGQERRMTWRDRLLCGAILTVMTAQYLL